MKQDDTRAVIGTDHEAAAIKAAAEAMPGLTREHAIQVATEALEAAAPHIRADERERCARLADKLAVWVPGKSLGPGRAEPGHWFSEDIRRGDDAT